MAWIPPNYRSPSASKDNEEGGFKYKKKKKASQSGTKAVQGFKDFFKEIKKLK